jgi:hypothetical protein
VTPSVEQVVEGWIRHFRSADMAMSFVSAEREVSVPLSDGVVLAGRLDAEGADYFCDWKSLNPRRRSGWREAWRFHPQSLTYGLLRRELGHPGRRFTIRCAFKSDPPSYDHEWFEYSDKELDTWRSEVLRIAYQMGETESVPHWALNPLSCYRWGPNYPCPFVHSCTHAEWDVPVTGLVRRVPHLVIEQQAQTALAERPECADTSLILDATRITRYLECPERYRREYIRQEVEPPGEALLFGNSFHSYLNEYYRSLINGRAS